MSTISQYVLTVICMVILCAIMQMIIPSGSAGALLKLMVGLVVTITVLTPLLKDRILQFDLQIENILSDGRQAVAEGEALSAGSYTQLIKEKTQTYIENKASALGVGIRAEVTLEKDYPNAPDTVTLTGAVSPYIKKQLSKSISEALGISEENQIWIS